MPSWRCDCKNVRSGLRLTKVNQEEKCVNCGYYAVADSDWKLFPHVHAGGGYLPIASARTLVSQGISWEKVYALKQIPMWMDLSIDEIKKEHHTIRKKDGEV